MRRLVGSLTVATLAVSGVLGGGAASTAAVGPPEPAAPGAAVVTPPLTYEGVLPMHTATSRSDVLQLRVSGLRPSTTGPTYTGPNRLIRLDGTPRELLLSLPGDQRAQAELRLVPAVGGLQVGTARRDPFVTDGRRRPFQVDLATGVGTWLPDPADAPGGLELRGVWGSHLVWDTAANRRPSGGVGLAVQPIGGTALRRIALPALDPLGGTLDVLPDGRALVALGSAADGGHLALVDLATGTVRDLGFAAYRPFTVEAGGVQFGIVQFGTLVGDHLVYVERLDAAEAPSATLHTCLLSAATCTSVDFPLTWVGPFVAWPAVTERGVAVPTADGVRWGPWRDGGVELSAEPVPGLTTAASIGGDVVGYDPTGHRMVTLDPATGATTTAYTFAPVPGRFDSGRLDAGAVLTDDIEAGWTRRSLGGGQTAVTVGPAVPGADTSGVWTVAPLRDTPGTVEVRDDGRLVGRVTPPEPGHPGQISGSTWIWRTGSGSVVYTGTTRGPTFSTDVVLDGPLVLDRAAATVTDLRTGVATPARFTCAARCYLQALTGPRVVLVKRARWVTVDWRTGTTIASGPLAAGGRLAAVDRDVLLVDTREGTDPWATKVPGVVEALRLPAQAGGPVTRTVLARGVGPAVAAGDGRAMWARGTHRTSPYVVAPVPGPARPAVLRSVLAADAVTARTPWAFAADVDGALTSWRLTITHPDGTTAARLTGSAALGAVRTSWTPPAGAPAGRYTWTLTGRSAMGDAPVVDPLGGPVTGGFDLTR